MIAAYEFLSPSLVLYSDLLTNIQGVAPAFAVVEWAMGQGQRLASRLRAPGEVTAREVRGRPTADEATVDEANRPLMRAGRMAAILSRSRKTACLTWPTSQGAK
jgi:hypothetical protein